MFLCYNEIIIKDNFMKPNYNLDKIKFSIDQPTFHRAVGLYEKGKIKNFKEDFSGYSAIVSGTHPYEVSVSNRYYDHGNCDCYLGQRDTLCKHMVAVAIYVIMGGKKLKKEDKELVQSPKCSKKLGELDKEQLATAKKSITSAIRYVKAYEGPSKIWFAYQSSLDEGVNRLSKIVSELPVSEQTTKLLIDMLLRLDKKLCTGGVDDSNGTVGNFIYEIVEMLKEYVDLDQNCIKCFKKLCDYETCFGWEEDLVRIFDEK